MTLYNQIQQLIMRCIDNKISVKAFREQFVPLFFSINRRFDIDVVPLADNIDVVPLADNVDNLYADLLIGDLTEDQFRLKLIQLTPIFTVTDSTVTKWPPFELAFEANTIKLTVPVVGPTAPQTSSDDVQFLVTCV